MIYDEFCMFREKCKNTNYFYCNIVLKNMMLTFISNSLKQLMSVNEDDVLYFNGTWREKISFKHINSKLFYENRDYCYDSINNPIPLCVLGVGTLYDLYGEVDNATLESIAAQLHESYLTYLRQKRDKGKKWAKKYLRGFEKEWSEYIKYWRGWMHEKVLFSELSDEDKELYRETENIIDEFDDTMHLDTALSGENSWFNIVWRAVSAAKYGVNEERKKIERIYRESTGITVMNTKKNAENIK